MAHNEKTFAWRAHAFIFGAKGNRSGLRPYLSAVAHGMLLEMRDGRDETLARVLSRDGTG